jgi:hypothetical protein
MIVAYIKVLFYQVSGGPEENHGEISSRISNIRDAISSHSNEVVITTSLNSVGWQERKY